MRESSRNNNIIKSIYENPTANVLLSGEKQDWEQGKEIHSHHFYSK